MNQETIKKSLLIIKSQPGGLGAVEGFLRNREWKVKATTNLKEALIFLVQEQPQFVMVSIDHPNRKVRNLPKILTQAFPVCVIAFAEENSAASYNLLSTCATEYLLYPPVTGPAVERTVNKYYKDLQTKGVSPQQMRTGLSSEEASVIAIKGEGGFSAQNAQSVLAQMFSDDAQGLGMIPGTSTNNSGPVGHGIGAGTLHSRMFDTDATTPLSSTPQKPQGNLPGWAPLPETNTHKKNRLTPEQVENDPQATKKDSIILRGTKEALENSCLKTTSETAQGIEASTNVSCIVIESSRFSGYLVTAMGKDKSLDAEFIGKIRERLFRFLRNNGEDIRDGDSMDLEIREVPFEDWALQYAEFLRKSIHNGNEVAMAFFPRADIKSNCGDSAAEEMASIHVDELTGDVAVEFNVYIHLPRNNKYVLYTPRGGVFYHTQKERLQSQGISQLHILKGDIKDLDKYRAQNFLNEKIQEYEEKERAKVTA
ncbi:hypothetical protein [Bdellovibrio sp. BCCA]|uniref:hypothetical protein n=1 Tax=Bdellovibrio sp. BCCA TaxID=3136281 RepID=UPI0030F17E5F